MKNYVVLFIAFAHSCFAMQANDLFKLPREQFNAYIEAQLQAHYPHEIFYTPTVPRRLAETYFHQWCDYYGTHNKSSFDILWMFWEKNKNDNNALLLERYTRAIVSYAFMLRDTQLPLEKTENEYMTAIFAVNSDLKVLSYIATGQKVAPYLQPEEWQLYWTRMVQAASSPHVVTNGPKILKRVRFGDTPSYKKAKKQ